MSLDGRVQVCRGPFELDAALSVEAGTTVALMGPNGAGKTTLLQAVAGLLGLSGGHLALGDAVFDDPATRTFVVPEHRPIGVVFQHYLLFPHLSALDNVAFGLRARGMARKLARGRARDWLDRVGLAAQAGARPSELSGGQSQRVALARALATEPDVLLLDEPLAALDATTRHEVRHDLRRHLAAFSGIAIVVTHDPIDAAVLADQVVVLDQGRIAQTGTPAEVTARPRTAWIATLAGTNLFAGTTDAAGSTLAVAVGGALVLGEPDAPRAERLAVVAPNAVTLSLQRPAGSSRNTWPGTVDTIEPLGGRLRVRVAGEPTIVAEITTGAGADLGLAPGVEVWVAVKATEISTYPG